VAGLCRASARTSSWKVTQPPADMRRGSGTGAAERGGRRGGRARQASLTTRRSLPVFHRDKQTFRIQPDRCSEPAHWQARSGQRNTPGSASHNACAVSSTEAPATASPSKASRQPTWRGSAPERDSPVGRRKAWINKCASARLPASLMSRRTRRGHVEPLPPAAVSRRNGVLSAIRSRPTTTAPLPISRSTRSRRASGNLL
jgi:hypothetical protein